MKQERFFPAVTVTRKQEISLKRGHPWIFEDEITEQPDRVENGSVVDVFGTRHNYLGSGLWSQSSRIRIRILSHNANDRFDDAFFARRIGYAVKYRREVMKEDFTCCRLIHGEADGLPGVTVDRYGGILVSQTASFGMDRRKDILYQALKKEIPDIKGIYERNEDELRLKEGLELYKGWYGEDHPASCTAEITENGITYEIDIENGQKTGFFLDQKYNRLAVRRLAEGKHVLDCCTHTGSFALNAAAGGAAEVTAMDISAAALAMAEKNAVRNGLDIKFRQGDVFEVLPRLKEEHAFFDFIILDPPAFTKSRKTYRSARSGYRQINAAAMKLLGRGGFLATCSCSHFMPKEAFISMLEDAASDAGTGFRLIEQKGASFDHPVIPYIPETEYLKFVLLQII